MNNDTPADAITQADRLAAADLIEAYWSGSNEGMMKLAKSYRAGHSHGAFVRAFAKHRATSLAAQDGLVEARDTIIKEQAAALAEHVNTNISLRKQLEDARSVALEEAAKVSEEVPIIGPTLRSWIDTNESPMGATRRHIATAIRALKGKS